MKTASMENTKDAPIKPRERAAGGPLEWWGRGRSAFGLLHLSRLCDRHLI